MTKSKVEAKALKLFKVVFPRRGLENINNLYFSQRDGWIGLARKWLALEAKLKENPSRFAVHKWKPFENKRKAVKRQRKNFASE